MALDIFRPLGECKRSVLNGAALVTTYLKKCMDMKLALSGAEEDTVMTEPPVVTNLPQGHETSVQPNGKRKRSLSVEPPAKTIKREPNDSFYDKRAISKSFSGDFFSSTPFKRKKNKKRISNGHDQTVSDEITKLVQKRQTDESESEIDFPVKVERQSQPQEFDTRELGTERAAKAGSECSRTSSQQTNIKKRNKMLSELDKMDTWEPWEAKEENMMEVTETKLQSGFGFEVSTPTNCKDKKKKKIKRPSDDEVDPQNLDDQQGQDVSSTKSKRDNLEALLTEIFGGTPAEGTCSKKKRKKKKKNKEEKKEEGELDTTESEWDTSVNQTVQMEEDLPDPEQIQASTDEKVTKEKNKQKAKTEEVEAINDIEASGAESSSSAKLAVNDTSTSSSCSSSKLSMDDVYSDCDDGWLKNAILEEFFKNKEFEECPFEIPPLHRIVNRASKPTPVQRVLLQASGIEPKHTRFLESEDHQIRANWSHFLQVHRLPNKPRWFYNLNKTTCSPAAKKRFLFFLGRHLPDRTLYSIFKRFKLLMLENMKTGKYASDEDQVIESLLKATGKHCVKEIAEQLNRNEKSVERRIKQLENNPQPKRIIWGKRNLGMFVKYLLKVTKTKEEDLEQLKDRHITFDEWAALSRKLDDVPKEALKHVWKVKLHHRLFMPRIKCDLRKLKLKLIRALMYNGETDWKTINWYRYTKMFDGFTNRTLHQFFKNLVVTHVPDDKQHILHECLRILNTLPEYRMRQRIIYKYVYSKGRITFATDTNNLPSEQSVGSDSM